LPQGNDSITAKYLGDSNYFASAISPAITVGVGQPGVNVVPCTGASIPINTPGQSGGCLITVSGSNGFAGTVTVVESVIGVHSGSDVDVPTCSFGMPDTNFSNNVFTLSSTTTSGTATLTCNTTAASSVMLRPSGRPSGRGWPLAGAALALAGLFFLVTVRRERRWSLVPLAVLLAVVVMAGVSCSGGSSGGGGTGGGNPGTTPDTYNVTVTATPSGNSSTVQTTTVAVVVQ
jgi:hypothetical protein